MQNLQFHLLYTSSVHCLEMHKLLNWYIILLLIKYWIYLW